MNRLAAVTAAVILSGCSMMIKSPTVANYSNLDKISAGTTRNDVAVLLGSPQGAGTHLHGDVANELQFYYGFAGEFSLSGATYDSGTAFITYKADKPTDAIYFRSQASSGPTPLKRELSIKDLAARVTLGASKVDDVFSALGKPSHTGRRINFANRIENTVAFWEASQLQNQGALKEKWLFVGYDNTRTVQDLIWVSSYSEDIQDFGIVSESQAMQLSRLTTAGFLPVLDPRGLSTGTKIDPVQVDALIKTSPRNIKDVISVLGQPSALGIKSFQGDEPMTLSNWSFSSYEIKGQEAHFIPPGASEEERRQLAEKSVTFHVMNIEQSRLMIGHTKSGEIKEIMWVKPLRM